MKTFALLSLLALVGITTLLAKGGLPVNDVCPVSGKAGRLIYRTFTEKGTVIFCCVDCQEAYQKNPARYPVKPKAEK